MSIALTCRNCGRLYEMPDDRPMWPCSGCSTLNEPPRAEGEALDKLQRAVRLRTRGEFILAEQCYNAVLAEYDDEHEALWGRLLCHYGVEFVVDEKTGGRFPVVHIPRRTLMQESADFLQACELAPEEIRAQYEADAAYVDEAQAEIRLLAEHSPAYDVFLCHKTTQLDSEAKTEDYDRAFKLYHGLDKQGFRVFFAPMELADVAGANYEAGIYHALHTARVMLVVCSDPAYLNSTWVQSEWRRYLELMSDETDPTPRTLIPLLYGMQAGRLPAPFRLRKLQGISMSDFGADAALLAVLQKYCGAPAAPCAPEDDFVTEAVDGGCSISAYRGKGGKVVIPPEIRGAKVVEIGESAFENCRTLTEIVIPDGVRCIGMTAFTGCTGLTEVSIPGSVKRILFGAFSDCVSLTRVTLPEGLTYLSDEVFDSCEKLVDVNLPGSVTDVRWNPFTDCPSLRTIRVAADNPRYAMRDGMLVSREGVLHCYPAGLRAAHFDIPAHVKRIALGAFEGCDILKTVHVPETVTHIEEHAFGYEPTMTLRVHEGSAAHAWTKTTEVAVEVLVRYAPEEHFATNQAGDGVVITRYTGPGGKVKIPPVIGGRKVVGIAEEAFRWMKQLTDVEIPLGVRSIGNWAFFNCSGLETVHIPESVTAIGHGAFANCGLETVELPASLDEMQGNPFSACARLTNISVSPDNRTFYTRRAVLLSRRGELICCPAGLQMTAYEIPENITTIGSGAFYGCTSLKELTVHAKVTGILKNAFADCPSLVLRVHEGSDSHQFAEKNRLPHTVIGARPAPAAPQPPVMEYAPESDFQTEACEGGVRITKYTGAGGGDIRIPRTIGGKPVVELGQMMFPDTGKPMKVGCITLPETVRDLYDNTFCGVRPERYEVEPGNVIFYARDGVIYRADRKMLIVYPSGSKATHFDIPAGTEEIFGRALRASCLQSITVPSSVRSIGKSAFSRCAQLSSVRLAEGLETLEMWAFQDCRALTSITLPASLRTVHPRAFLLCKNLREICVAPGNQYLRVQDGLLIDNQNRLLCCPPARLQTLVTVPEGIQTIGDAAFYGCDKLQRVDLPASLRAIEDFGFYGGTALRSLTIPAQTTVTGDNVFTGCKELKLRVQADSPAHSYARKMNIAFEIVKAAPAAAKAVPAAAKAAPAAAKPAQVDNAALDPNYAYLLIKRTKRWVASAGKIAVRVDGKDKEVLYFANGESRRLKLTPGHHQIDLKFKPMLGGEVKWSGMLCRKNVFPAVMQAGKEYTLDLADWIEKLQL